MRVSHLQQFIRLLVPPLTASGINQSSANAVSKQLEAIVSALDPFGDMEAEQLGELLRIADEYRRTGQLPGWVLAKKPAEKKPKASKAPKMTVEQAVESLRGIQQRARSMDPSAVESEVRRLEVLTAADLKKVQSEFLGVVVGKKKADHIDALIKRIEDVRMSHDRSAEILSY